MTRPHGGHSACRADNPWPCLFALLCLMVAMSTVTQPEPQQGGGLSRDPAPSALRGLTIKRPLYFAVCRVMLVPGTGLRHVSGGSMARPCALVKEGHNESTVACVHHR